MSIPSQSLGAACRLMRCLCHHRAGYLVQDCCVDFAITAFGAWCSAVVLAIPSQSLARGAVVVRCLCPHRVRVQLAVLVRCLCPHRVGCLVQYCWVDYGITASGVWSHALRCLCPHSVWYVMQSCCVDYGLADIIFSCLYVLGTQYVLREGVFQRLLWQLVKGV